MRRFLAAAIPLVIICLTPAITLNATETDTAAHEAGAGGREGRCAASPCRTTLRGTLTAADEMQLQDMQSELYRMREETWDDRYRY